MFAVSDEVRNPEISFMLEIDGQQKTVLTLSVQNGKFNIEVPDDVSMTQAAIQFFTVLTEIYPAWQAERNPEVTTKDPHDPWYAGVRDEELPGMPADAFFLDGEDTVEVIQPTTSAFRLDCIADVESSYPKISELPNLPEQDEVFYVRYNPDTDSLSKVPLKNRQMTTEISFDPTVYDTTFGYEVEIDPECTVDIGKFSKDELADAVEIYHEERPISISVGWAPPVFGATHFRCEVTEEFAKTMDNPVLTSGTYMRPESAERLDTRMGRIQPAEAKQEVSWSSGSYEKE
jgi:hypothetical protein